mmetsp:Transcript_61612/g.144909  ORF Transcript_61612/g.144909 Transcript_61612/m.144909 type:complete len:255 (-) Transcript_61612:437-1201(-)
MSSATSSITPTANPARCSARCLYASRSCSTPCSFWSWPMRARTCSPRTSSSWSCALSRICSLETACPARPFSLMASATIILFWSSSPFTNLSWRCVSARDSLSASDFCRAVDTSRSLASSFSCMCVICSRRLSRAVSAATRARIASCASNRALLSSSRLFSVPSRLSSIADQYFPVTNRSAFLSVSTSDCCFRSRITVWRSSSISSCIGPICASAVHSGRRRQKLHRYPSWQGHPAQPCRRSFSATSGLRISLR